jgi:hypothetical protein
VNSIIPKSTEERIHNVTEMTKQGEEAIRNGYSSFFAKGKVDDTSVPRVGADLQQLEQTFSTCPFN